MRIAVHTPVGTFVSRILSQEEHDVIMTEKGEESLIMEGQSGQDIVICYNVLINSVIEVMPDEAIRSVTQFDGNYVRT